MKAQEPAKTCRIGDFFFLSDGTELQDTMYDALEYNG